MKNYTVTEDELVREETMIADAKKNPACFRPLYEKYFREIFLYIYHKVIEKETAADITSQTFLKALQNLNKYRHRNLPFSAWLFRIATNEVMQYFRNHKKSRKFIISNHLIEEVIEEADGNNIEYLKDNLVTALQYLSIHDIQLIELRFYEKKSFREIGYILDITETNAKVKTYRVLDKIRENMIQSKP